ncbi:MAG TPA: TorF family putative porin [Nevskiaceae bacterium]|nr:TorF family putative porin [Nevskiaceae bacterium]
MNFKRLMVGSLVGAASLMSAPAFAGATGNVGAFSEYMFRGIAQTGGAAVQGGIDYASDSGLYVGSWASNIGFGGGTELDLYGGYAGKIGDVGFDLGVIYYYYTEEDEAAAELNTFELKLGASFGAFGVQYFYADEANFFIGDGAAEDAAYLNGTLALPISETLNFTANLGFYSGDEIERFLVGIGSTDDSYIDYHIGLAKSLDGGMTATFQIIDTDIEASGTDDEMKVVVGLKKAFDL